LTFCGDGDHIITGETYGIPGTETTIGIWEVTSRRLLHRLQVKGEGRADSVIVSPDCRYIGVRFNFFPTEKASKIEIWQKPPASHDSSKKICEASNDSKFHCCSLDTRTDKVKTIAFSGGEKTRYLASGSADGKLIVWDLEGPRYEEVLRKSAGGSIFSVAFSHDGKYLAAGTKTDVTIWRVGIWSCDVRLVGPTGSAARSADFSPTGRYIRSEYKPLSFSPTERYIASGFRNTVVIWELMVARDGDSEKLTPKLQGLLEGHIDTVISMAYTSDDCLMSSECGTVKIWEPRTLVPVGDNDTDGAACLTFSVDGRYFASGTKSSLLQIWSTRKERRVGTIGQNLPYRLMSVATSPTGEHLALGYDTGVGIWESSTEPCGWTLAQDLSCRGKPLAIAFSSKGTFLAVYEEASNVTLWKQNDNSKKERWWIQQELKFPGWYGRLQMAFSFNNKYFAVVASGKMRIWSVTTTGTFEQLIPEMFPVPSSTAFALQSYINSFEIEGVDCTNPDQLLRLSRDWRIPARDIDLEEERSWITWEGEKVVWIPIDYRPGRGNQAYAVYQPPLLVQSLMQASESFGQDTSDRGETLTNPRPSIQPVNKHLEPLGIRNPEGNMRAFVKFPQKKLVTSGVLEDIDLGEPLGDPRIVVSSLSGTKMTIIGLSGKPSV
jgi:WD40 repeat protein